MEGSLYQMFPYRMRPIQEAIVCSVETAIRTGGHIVVEAGTGSGKTVSALVPALYRAFQNGKRILYLTRTNSQQVQVVKEFRAIRNLDPPPQNDTGGPPPDLLESILSDINGDDPGVERQEQTPNTISCAPIQGRSGMCPMMSDDPELMTGTPEELSRLCSEMKRNSLLRVSGKPTSGTECSFYAGFLLDDGKAACEWAVSNMPTAEELSRHCISEGTCPYEVNKALARRSVLVCAPYIFFFHPFIRKNMLEWMGCSPKDLIVIVDEAHNLASFIRDMGSMVLTTNTVRLAMMELGSVGDRRAAGKSVSTFLSALLASLESIALEHLIDEDGLVPPTSLCDEMMIKLSTNSARLDAIAGEAALMGEELREMRKASGKLPRSHVLTCANFYRTWNNLEFDLYTPLIVKGRREGDLSLEAFALDPKVMTHVLGDVHASIHMSGTLSPLEEYRDSIGLPENAVLLRLPPPFPLSNRLMLYDPELSTNHERLMREPETVIRIRERILSLLEKARGRSVAVFFPSFALMRSVLGNEELEDGFDLPVTLTLERPLFIERRGSSQNEVMELVDEFKATQGSALFSVIGGRLSEGMDYPGECLEMVIVVGIPYPKPNARQRAICSYYDILFRKGWEYTVHAPAARKMLQSVGRMIRSGSDRGVGFIIDRRAIHFTDQIPDIRVAYPDGSDVSAFFSNGPNHSANVK